jgi:hypothetical protein
LSGTNYNHYSGVKLITPTAPATELDYSQKVLDSVAHVQGIVSVPALDVDEEAPDPVAKYEEPKPGEYKEPVGFKSAKDTGASPNQSSGKARVAWTAGQNKLVDDAARHAAQKCSDKVVSSMCYRAFTFCHRHFSSEGGVIK